MQGVPRALYESPRTKTSSGTTSLVRSSSLMMWRSIGSRARGRNFSTQSLMNSSSSCSRSRNEIQSSDVKTPSSCAGRSRQRPGQCLHSAVHSRQCAVCIARCADYVQCAVQCSVQCPASAVCSLQCTLHPHPRFLDF